MVENGRPSRRVPWKVTRFIMPEPACTRLGAASASAPYTSGVTKCPIACRPPVANGGCALSMQPGGANTEMGAIEPALLGMVGSSSDLLACSALALVSQNGTLRPARTQP